MQLHALIVALLRIYNIYNVMHGCAILIKGQGFGGNMAASGLGPLVGAGLDSSC